MMKWTYLARSADTNEKEMSLNLSEHPVDAKDVVQDVIEQNEGNVQLFLVEDAESCLGVFAQQLSVDWDVVFRGPVREKDGSGESFISVNGGEVIQRGAVDIFVRPCALFFRDKTILEESQRFVGPNANQPFDGENFEGSNGFIDTTNPTGKFTRTVDIMSLGIGCKSFLGCQVEGDHGVGERFSVGTKVGNDFEESSVVRPVDLLQRDLSRIVNHDERRVSQEPVAQRNTTRIGWGITGADELNPFQLDPCHITRPPVSTAFNELTNEGDDTLRSIFIGCGKVDFVAEND